MARRYDAVTSKSFHFRLVLRLGHTRISGVDILLIDDEPELRQALAEVLKDAGHAITEVGDGQAAVGLISTKSFDVILSDVRLPGVDGLKLLRLARNVAIDHVRANRLTPTETVIDPDTSSTADLDRAETVRSALATLPAEQRQVVILRHVVGLSPGEIAQRMGRSEGSIHGLHHRGRRALRQELERLDSQPCTVVRRRELAAA